MASIQHVWRRFSIELATTEERGRCGDDIFIARISSRVVLVRLNDHIFATAEQFGSVNIVCV